MKHLMLIVLLFAGFQAHALSGAQIAYYGADFYQSLQQGVKDQALRDQLFTILNSTHKLNPGTFDAIDNACSGTGCYRQTPVGYNAARVFLFGKFYLHGDAGHYSIHDVYCQHEYTEDEFRDNKPAPSTIPSAVVLNCEHTWPQSHFTREFSEDMQKSDVHHLFPSDSKVNSIRGNYHFGEVSQDLIKIPCNSGARFGRSAQGAGGQIFEPPAVHKGNVARALIYFAVRYKMKMDPAEEAFARKWHHEDPVDEEEATRNDQIYQLQGDRNPFIDHPELVDLIQDI